MYSNVTYFFNCECLCDSRKGVVRVYFVESLVQKEETGFTKTD